jgi:probable F420-dependent oxidoreductase
MKIGVMMFPTDTSIQPMDVARAVEERGFESLWFPEHSHIPTSRQTPWGGREGAPPLPDMYWRSHDQFVALTAAAAVTENLKVATGICLVAQRDPIWLAKQVASLDAISGGRFLFGIGYGWNKEEMAHHGVAYMDRRDRIRECILAMKELWTAEEAEYHGEHISFESSWSWPKPTQKPHPPIILGGDAGPRTIADIVEFCDGWMPIAGRHPLSERLPELRAAAEAAGRDPDSIELGVFGATDDTDRLDKLRETGVRRAVLGLPSAGPDEVLPLLDRYAPLLEKYAD